MASPGGYTGGYPAGAAGGTTTGTLPSWATGLGVAGDLYGMYQSAQLGGAARNIYQQSNPFGMYRPQFGAELTNLMQDPSSVTSLPGYQFLMGQGVGAIDRSAAAPGGVGFGSTGEKGLLEQYGQGLADQFYQQQVSTLSNLAGANIQPANPAAALAGMGGAATSQGQSMQMLIANLARMFPGQGGGGGGSTFSPSDAYGSTVGGGGYWSGPSAADTAGAPTMPALDPSVFGGGDSGYNPTVMNAGGATSYPDNTVSVPDLTGMFSSG